MDEGNCGELEQLDRGYLDNLGVGHRVEEWHRVCQNLAERKG
jgi:hypothetical protein